MRDPSQTWCGQIPTQIRKDSNILSEVPDITLVKTLLNDFYTTMAALGYIERTSSAKRDFRNFSRECLQLSGPHQTIAIGSKIWQAFLNWMRIWIIISTYLRTLQRTERRNLMTGSGRGLQLVQSGQKAAADSECGTCMLQMISLSDVVQNFNSLPLTSMI